MEIATQGMKKMEGNAFVRYFLGIPQKHENINKYASLGGFSSHRKINDTAKMFDDLAGS